MSSGTRRALFVVWVVCMLFLLWNPPESWGYWMPAVLIAAGAVTQTMTFVASRFERTDVSSVELAVRRLFFKPDPAAKRGGTPL